ncbi:endothelin-1 [Sebastes fasciatus]|uniref:endothelin-1 n=1 Tax=Sebastes fasciatus TaxID=394691 RepID=UPI003D9F99AD
MDSYILISVFSVMNSWILCTVLSAPAGETPTASTTDTDTQQQQQQQRSHVRTKRCSCANFLDNECIYFCHLDIIWVNTPERMVSYGLGNSPRTRRAVAESLATSSGPRCQCLHQKDNTCRNFCHLENSVLRYETPPDALIRSAEGDACAGAQCKQMLAADTGRIKRMRNSNKKRVSPLAIRAAVKTSMLLKKWRARQRRRARSWQGESTAS